MLKNFFRRENKDNDDVKVSARDIRDSQTLQTVGLFLGPYRNLTTLTASVLFLHPNCQVLNHAGPRIFSKPELAFLDEYSQFKMDKFTQYALAASEGGKRGGFGGSVALAHAFSDHEDMQSAYEMRYGKKLRKEKVDALVWKESQLTSNFIRERNVDLASIFRQNSQLRFLMPVRNPIDCAISNAKTGAGKYLLEAKSQAPIDLLETILFEEAWGFQLKEKFPDRIFCFFEHEISRSFFENLAEFLKLRNDERWLAEAERTFRVKQGYKASLELAERMRQLLETNFNNMPGIKDKYLKLLD